MFVMRLLSVSYFHWLDAVKRITRHVRRDKNVRRTAGRLELSADFKTVWAAAAGTLNDSTDTITGDGAWDKLGPGDVITFTSSYTVVAGDLNSAGGGTGTGFSGGAEPDGYLDNTATATMHRTYTTD